MPKMILTIIFLIVFLTLLYALTVSEKHTDELGKYTTRLLRVGFIITLLCIFILGTNEERTIEFLYCLYFGCFSLLCKSLFDFSLVYTDWLQSYRCCSFFAMILVAIDSVSLVLNFFFVYKKSTYAHSLTFMLRISCSQFIFADKKITEQS